MADVVFYRSERRAGLYVAALVHFHELIYLLPVAPVIMLLRHSHDL